MEKKNDVTVEVIHADALTAANDVLVLKHAQAPFGADRAAEERLGLNLEGSLHPGQYRFVSGGSTVGAREVLFLGVPPLKDFGYREIQSFARSALSVLHDEAKPIHTVGLTLHGVGFGLDEAACFESEIDGLLEASDRGSIPANLDRIQIFERDAARFARLSRLLLKILPAERRCALVGTEARLGADRSRSSASRESRSRFCSYAFRPGF